VPVLLIRAGAEWPQELREPLFPRVLVPLDDSNIAEEILPHVLSLATPSDTTLVLLSVVDPGPALRATAVDLRPDDQKPARPLTESVTGATEARLARLADELRANCVNVITEVIVDSHPAQCILTYAERQRIDLVALCTHSRGALGRALMGATADKLIRGAPTPVLVFHPGGRGTGATAFDE
jgi:nucleotide-binding universal stress UspA family protein